MRNYKEKNKRVLKKFLTLELIIKVNASLKKMRSKCQMYKKIIQLVTLL